MEDGKSESDEDWIECMRNLDGLDIDQETKNQVVRGFNGRPNEVKKWVEHQSPNEARQSNNNNNNLNHSGRSNGSDKSSGSGKRAHPLDLTREDLDAVRKNLSEVMMEPPDNHFLNNIKSYMEKGGLSSDSIQSVVEKASKIIDKATFCHETEEEGKNVSGLVFGQVQSGKTMSILTLISLCLDRGYKFIILLTGRTQVLRNQSQDRLSESGIAKSDRISLLTSPGEDISGKSNSDRFEEAKQKGNYPIIAVIKKNATSLEWTRNLLSGKSSVSHTSGGGHKKRRRYEKFFVEYRDSKAIIIDDECDDATLNYKPLGDLPSKIYELITEIQVLWTDHPCHHIGYTATPYPNILFNPTKELFPKFVVSLEIKGEGYVGLDMFTSKRNIEEIPLGDYPSVGSGPLVGVHSKQEEFLKRKIEEKNYPPSLQKMLIFYVVSGAIKRLRKPNSTPPTPTPGQGITFKGEHYTCDNSYNNLFELLLSDSPDEKYHTDQLWKLAGDYLDSDHITLKDLNVKTSDIKKGEFTQQMREDFWGAKVLSRPSSKQWTKILAEHMRAMFIFLKKPHGSSELQPEDTIGTGKTNIYIWPKNDQLVYLNFNEEPAQEVHQEVKPIYHASLLHFSERNAVTEKGYLLVKDCWDWMKPELEKYLSRNPKKANQEIASMIQECQNTLKRRKNVEENFDKSDFQIAMSHITKNTEIKLCNSNSQDGYQRITKFDYEGRTAPPPPENMIVIGGNILGRGITIKGLTVSYYVRAANRSAMDVSLQHCRWFGWHKDDHDLVTLFTGERQLKLFQDIAASDISLRKEIKHIEEKDGLFSEYITKIKKMDTFIITQPSKSRNSTTWLDTHRMKWKTPLPNETTSFQYLDDLWDLTRRCEEYLVGNYPEKAGKKMNKNWEDEMDLFVGVPFEMIGEVLCGWNNEELNRIIEEISNQTDLREDAGLVNFVIKKSTKGIHNSNKESHIHPAIKRYGLTRRSRSNDPADYIFHLEPSQPKDFNRGWDGNLDYNANPDWFDVEDHEPKTRTRKPKANQNGKSNTNPVKKPPPRREKPKEKGTKLVRKSTAPVLLFFYILDPFYIGQKEDKSQWPGLHMNDYIPMIRMGAYLGDDIRYNYVVNKEIQDNYSW
eukprot:TRINITY_DN3767_c0_g1_i2.p1 TRINITY_DN3767_c0_g1~~TRINITY_DN3767_c0_g1_i2.p1  ORF type:complete len:1181 (-),score=275.62 TRINITY_DN3767_c0_g1_i2:1637-5005(-)